jgi:hypothetical protein
MIQYTSDSWTGCLLKKLGFDYSDSLIKFGMPDSIYGSSVAMSSNEKFRYQKLTTLKLIYCLRLINLKKTVQKRIAQDVVLLIDRNTNTSEFGRV